MTQSAPMPDTAASAKRLQELAASVSARLDADLILFNAGITEDTASRLRATITPATRHRSAVVILATHGGDAHAAYVVGRMLQTRYERLTMWIAGPCYSAGTLVVLAAHEVVIAGTGRLGPVDVQLLKKDELFERLSGLTGSNALTVLQEKALETFMHFFVQLEATFAPVMAMRTAMDCAATMTAQMFGEMYKQIDPIKLGEDVRALRIASHYGERLQDRSKNLKKDAVQRLLNDYPSHACIIDQEEAKEIFCNVREPQADELELIGELGPFATSACTDNVFIMRFGGPPDQDGEGNAERGPASADGTEPDVSRDGTQAGGAGVSAGCDEVGGAERLPARGRR